MIFFTEATDWYNQKTPSFGFTKFLPLAKLHSKDGGFLVNDELKIVAEVHVLQVIGEAEGSQESVQPMKKTKMNGHGTRVGNETFDINGFQVSTSQVR